MTFPKLLLLRDPRGGYVGGGFGIWVFFVSIIWQIIYDLL